MAPYLIQYQATAGVYQGPVGFGDVCWGDGWEGADVGVAAVFGVDGGSGAFLDVVWSGVGFGSALGLQLLSSQMTSVKVADAVMTFGTWTGLRATE
jgi:hypothetical protein